MPSSLDLPDETAHPEAITKLISELKEGGDTSSLAKSLASPIESIGLNEDQFNEVFDLILEGSITSTQRNYLLQNCLLPNGDFIIESTPIYRIISSIGIQETHYKKGVKQKPKVLAVSTQQKLLEWLICSLHLFGTEAYSTINRLLPVLFNLLSYEFLRPPIANLIFLAVLNSHKPVTGQLNTHHQIHLFKPWHVQLVVDLFLKFPLDNSLKSLLVLFKSLNPALDLNSFCRDNTIYDFLSLSLSDSVFTYPNASFLDKLNHIKQNHAVEKNLKLYESFSRTSVKRRRRNLHSSSEIDLDTLEFNSSFSSSQVSITDITSNLALINNLENIRFVNISGLFSINRDLSNFLVDKYKRYFLILLSLFSSNQKSWNKLEYYTRLSLLDDNLSLNDLSSLVDEIDGFLLQSSGYTSLKCINDYLAFKYNSLARNPKSRTDNKAYENIVQRLKLLRYSPTNDDTVVEFVDNIASFTWNTFTSKTAQKGLADVIQSTASELSTLFSIWYLQISHPKADSESKERVFRILNYCFPKLYQVFLKNFNSIPLSAKMLIFKLFNCLRSISSSDWTYLEDHTIFIPPSLAYQLIMSSHPLFVSEFGGYLSDFKSFDYNDSAKQSTQSSFVLDFINFIWRDKAFQSSQDKYPFLLPSSLINKLGTLSIFNNTNLIKFTTVGNVFHNPGFSLITTEILWSLEDTVESLAIRHAGPVTEESVSNLLYNHRGEWLDLKYDELRLKILRRLDKLGYKGLCDLLFGSLRTISELREE